MLDEDFVVPFSARIARDRKQAAAVAVR